MSSDDPREPASADATRGSTPTSVEGMSRDLAEGLHRLAIEAGVLERLVRDAGGVGQVDHDVRLTLDQAHSNASAIVATLGRAGFG